MYEMQAGKIVRAKLRLFDGILRCRHVRCCTYSLAYVLAHKSTDSATSHLVSADDVYIVRGSRTVIVHGGGQALRIWNGRACAIRPPTYTTSIGVRRSPLTNRARMVKAAMAKQNEGEDSDGIGIGVIATAGGGALVFIVFALYILQRRRSSS